MEPSKTIASGKIQTHLKITGLEMSQSNQQPIEQQEQSALFQDNINDQFNNKVIWALNIAALEVIQGLRAVQALEIELSLLLATTSTEAVKPQSFGDIANLISVDIDAENPKAED